MNYTSGCVPHLTEPNEMIQHLAYLSLGSNIGDRAAYLDHALQCLVANGVVEKKSSIWETQAWGYEDSKPYLNMACTFRTSLKVWPLMHFLKQVELHVGRQQRSAGTERYAAREIDIDILFYDELVLQDEELNVPHPRIELRNFVLQPMSEIAPFLWHPLLGKTIEELLSETRDSTYGVKLIHGL